MAEGTKIKVGPTLATDQVIVDVVTTHTTDMTTINNKFSNFAHFTSDFADFNAAITHIGATETKLYVNSDVSLTGNCTVPPNVDLEFIKGNIISCGNYNLIINGSFTCGLSQAFAWVGGAITFGADTTPEVFIQWFGAKADNSTNCIPAINKALASITQGMVKIPTGTYLLSGGTPIDFDMYKKSMEGIGGGVIFNCTNMTTSYTIKIFCSGVYPQSHLNNNLAKLKGIYFYGNKTSGRDGLHIGHDTYDNSGQLKIEDCAFYQFDTCVRFINNSWRISFERCGFSDGLTHAIYFNANLINSGEATSFYHCMVHDGATSNITVDSNNQQLQWYSSSILNTPVIINGAGVNFNMYGGNIENPNNPVYYQYVTFGVSASLSSMNFIGTGITLNNQTADATPITYNSAVFASNESQGRASFNFSNCIFPSGFSSYKFENTDGYKCWVKGTAKVTVAGFNASINGGSHIVAFTPNNNVLINSSFASGSGYTGWTVVPYGNNAVTASVITTDKHSGNACLKVVALSGSGANISQTVRIQPGQTPILHGWTKVVSAGAAGTVGYLSYEYRDFLDNIIGTTYGDDVMNTYTNWSYIGGMSTSFAPPGAASVKVILNIQIKNVIILFDDILLNIV